MSNKFKIRRLQQRRTPLNPKSEVQSLCSSVFICGLIFCAFALCAAETLAGEDGEARPKRIVLAIAEQEYETAQTLPAFAARHLHAPHGFDIVICEPDPITGKRLAGFVEAMADADLLLLSIRRRALHPDEMAAVKAHLAAGKPIVGIRTANHAFYPREDYPDGYETWEKFDHEVIGGNYDGHHGSGPKTTVTRAPGADEHPIVKGVEGPFTAHGSLYKVSPLKQAAQPLLIGRIPGAPAEPVAWTHRYGDARIFYTSLGHPEDFQELQFVRLLSGAVLWALGTE